MNNKTLARHCVERFLQQHSEQPQKNVIILGSGFDSRFYRLSCFQSASHIRTYEVDAPGTQAVKKRVLCESGIDFGHVNFVECDFERQDWFQCLKEIKTENSSVPVIQFDESLPTLIVWEGVTMYLAKSTVIETLQKVSYRGKGRSDKTATSSVSPWYIAFDYADGGWAMSETWQRALRRAKEPLKFAMTGSGVAEELIQSCGLEVVEHLHYSHGLGRRYFPMLYQDKPISFIGRYGGFMLARTIER